MPTTKTALWQRLDKPGHDACRLIEVNEGWQLQGTAVFGHELGPAVIEYSVVCDSAWRSRVGRVRGWIGERNWNLHIEQLAAGEWTLNGVRVKGLEKCLDPDFGFTPATNLLQLNRVNLAPGTGADIPAAWLDLPEASLRPLPQRYERRTTGTYWYEAPIFEYAGLLELADSGFVRSYPGLWRMEE